MEVWICHISLPEIVIALIVSCTSVSTASSLLSINTDVIKPSLSIETYVD